MVILITSDLFVAIGVVAVLLGSLTVVNAMSCELQSYTVSPACAISLSYFGTIPASKRKHIHINGSN